MSEFKLQPQIQIAGSAVFDGPTIRRELRRWWVDSPKKWAAWLMLNPSIARADKNDPTMLRVIHFSRAWGCDGCIVVNLYPLVASNPADMWRWSQWEENGPDYHARDVIARNRDDIERVGREAFMRMVAFGVDPANVDPSWLDHCLEAFGQPSDQDYDENFYCLGTSKSGQPLHPLARGRQRVPDDMKPILWGGV